MIFFIKTFSPVSLRIVLNRKFLLNLLLSAGGLLALNGCALAGAAASAAAYTAGSAVSLAGHTATTAAGLLSTKYFFGCLPEGSLIDTPNGTQPVESLKPGDQVTGYSGRTVTVQQIHAYDEDETAAKFLSLEFQDHAKVELSQMHRIGGVRAGDLKIGQTIHGGHTLTSISRYAGVNRSYDLLTEDRGYRIGGVPVNSMIVEMLQSAKTGKIRD